MPRFEIFKDKSGKFRVRLKADNGEIIAVSESYMAKPKALKVIDVIRRSVASSKVVDLTSPARPAPGSVGKSAKKAPIKKATKKPARKPARPPASASPPPPGSTTSSGAVAASAAMSVDPTT